LDLELVPCSCRPGTEGTPGAIMVAPAVFSEPSVRILERC
jgi:hypothetical protein